MARDWRLLRAAASDLECIQTEGVAEFGSRVVVETFDELIRQLDLLIEHPRMGRTGRVDGTRELVIGGTPFIAVYRVADQTIDVLRILHGRQQWPS